MAGLESHVEIELDDLKQRAPTGKQLPRRVHKVKECAWISKHRIGFLRRTFVRDTGITPEEQRLLLTYSQRPRTRRDTAQGALPMATAENKDDLASPRTKTAQVDKEGDEGFLELWSLAKATGLDQLLWGGLTKLAPSLGVEPTALVTGVQHFASAAATTPSSAAEHGRLQLIEGQVAATQDVLRKLMDACERRLKSLETSKASVDVRVTKLDQGKSEAERMAEIQDALNLHVFTELELLLFHVVLLE